MAHTDGHTTRLTAPYSDVNAAARDPFLAPVSDVNIILTKIREQLFNRHGFGHGPYALDSILTAADANSTGCHNQFEFEAALAKSGVFLPVAEVHAVMRHFDNQGSHGKCISYKQFIDALKLPLNERRWTIAKAVFEYLDIQGAGQIQVDQALEVMRPERHPDVVQGRATANQVREEFRAYFQALDGLITPEYFRAFYQRVSEFEPYDGVFVKMMEEVWGVKEAYTDVVALVQQLLVDKAEQHSHNGETHAEVLRKALKYYDIQGSNTINQDQFTKALQYYGIYLDDAVITAVFHKFEREGGVIHIDEFIREISPREDFEPSRTGWW